VLVNGLGIDFFSTPTWTSKHRHFPESADGKVRLDRRRGHELAALVARELDALAIWTHLVKMVHDRVRFEHLPAPVRAGMRPRAQLTDLVVICSGFLLNHLVASSPTPEGQIIA
jgi:hypothetical protein